MAYKHTTSAILAAAISTPNLLAAAPVIANEVPGEVLRLAQTERRQTQQPTAVLAVVRGRDGKQLSERQLRQELSKELAALTPAQKKELGEARIQRAQRMTPAQFMDAAAATTAGTCVTNGVGCGGTPNFTKGFLCCIAKKL